MMRRCIPSLLPVLAVALLGFGLMLSGAERLHAPRSPDDVRRVILSSNGWHTGIILSVADIPPGRLPAVSYFPSSTMIEIGWGEAGFYRAKEITLGLSLKALFASEGSVMHLVGFSQPPEVFFRHNENITIDLSREGFDRLLAFIERAFSRGQAGEPVFLGPGLYRNSYFFASDTRYSLLNTCNTWVAHALLASGLPLRPLLALRSDMLLFQISPYGQPLRQMELIP